MAEITFEGEVDILTPRQQELVKEVLQKRELKADKVRIETLGKAGDNYIANVKKIAVELNNGDTFKIVAKIATNNETVRAAMGTVMLFENECVIYNEILPKFAELQKAAGLLTEEYFCVPECYGTLMEHLNEIILLEDLSVNYKMLDRFTPLTNDCVKLILKNFAVLHSLSFVLKLKDPDAFIGYGDKLKDYYAWMNSDPDAQYYFDSLEADTISLLEGDKYKNAIRGSVSKLGEISAKIIRDESSSRFSVVTHGDGWTNNIMFRFKDNVPAQAVLIDYQLSKVGNPVNDLLYMIYTSTDHNTRQKHYFEWIDHYHNELNNALSNYGLKANYIYPREKLDADLLRYSKVYLGTAVILNTMLIRRSEDAAKMMDLMESSATDPEMVKEQTEAVQVSNLDAETVALFRRRIEDLVDSYREFGYID